MRPLLAILFTATATAQIAGCGVDMDPGDDDTTTDPPPAADGYTRLISGAWTLPPATEKYVCVRLTATQDTFVRSLRPLAPTGTHHTVLMLGAPDGKDGTVDCTSALSKPAIYASGVGTQALDLPAGVAVHVRPGQQLLLNLHLFNATDATITGTSGIEILEAEPDAVQHEAGVVLIGKAQGLTVPPNLSTQTGRCTTPANVTVFALAPHMHMLGRHMKVSYANASGGDARVLHDQAYSFDEQRFASMAPALVTSAGGRITVECTYMNPSGQTVYFGESSSQEMCYALTFVYPAPPVEQCLQ
ncbi:MAG TPA: hypothetical protein VNO30_38190 [Kofleriaceae bacterium]|nr:hypothetical protein [Kofleriaceae bacterium]